MVTRGMVCRADLNLSFSGHWREHDSLVGAQWTLEKVSPLVHEEETKEPRACLRSQRACGRIWLAAQAAGIQAVTRGSTARLQAGFGACLWEHRPPDKFGELVTVPLSKQPPDNK